MELNNKPNVLITGGAGYLGSFLTEQLIRSGQASRVVVYSRDELKHFDLRIKLGHLAEKVDFVIGDVRDAERLKEAFEDIDIVIHTAALKQVPACEQNPSECYKTNVSGTEKVIQAAKESGVKKLIFVSTDKAVEPVSVYGNSKQAGEKLVLNANSKGISCSVLRFGNLIGSPGSIIDKLKKQQIKEFVLYHPDFTRFFDSVENAWALVVQQMNGDFGGTIMMPKLQAIRISDLIMVMDPTVKIIAGGDRSFEKVHEKLATKSEMQRAVENNCCYIITPKSLSLNEALDQYKAAPARTDSYSSDQVDQLHSWDVMKIM